MAKKKREKGKLWKEFKNFINKGNAFMLAVGVVIGGAFSAITNAFVNILLSVCTWAVPGGLKGLVTVLPALNDAQKGMDATRGLGQFFDASKLQELAKVKAIATYGEATVNETPTLIENVKATILSKYTLHGTTYTYNMSAVIDWGTLINAFISFIIIALVLFTIVKVANAIAAKKKQIDAQLLEAYYVKHPEERPAPVEPGKPAPTEAEILTQILVELKKSNGEKPTPEEEK
ncbi:MAG: MscL family protein [Mollicutes bacterium]|nr:MscL family protein [Mollicutes bacterium]